MKMKLTRIVAFICMLCMLAGCGHSCKAAEYVEANLHLIFQGETHGAKEFIEASEDDLEQMYENGIQAFVEDYLTSGVDENGTYTDLFGYLMKEIFFAMKYQVGEAKEVDNNTYEVPVTYQPVDVFQKFVESVKLVSIELENKKAAGGYEGTEKEQAQAMFIEYLQSSYDILGKAYLDMEYQEEETFTFHVKEGKNHLPELEGKEINQFIESILALDKL